MTAPVGLQGFICRRGEVNFEYCINYCPSRCHPLPLLFALMAHREVVPNVYSVTEILNPPQIVYLRRNRPYYNTIESLIWMTLGTAWHSVVEAQEESIVEHGLGGIHGVEQAFEVNINGTTLTGRADYYDGETKTLWDFKTMKVYPVKKIMAGDWEDSTYKEQLNIYKVYGFPGAEHLKIEAIVKDWAIRTKDVRPLEVIDVPMMPESEVRNMTEMLLMEHTNAQKSGRPRECTDEERWYRNGVYQRCKDYCAVSGVCPQYNEDDT